LTSASLPYDVVVLVIVDTYGGWPVEPVREALFVMVLVTLPSKGSVVRVRFSWKALSRPER
jgi:hypothetical protein